MSARLLVEYGLPGFISRPAVNAPVVGNEWDPEDVFEVLGNEHVRQILALADVRPLSADELAEHTDASLPTVYRRVDVLQEYDMIREETRIDDEGNHYKVYETALEQVCFEVANGGFTVNVELREDLVDKFSDFWSDLERGGNEP